MITKITVEQYRDFEEDSRTVAIVRERDVVEDGTRVDGAGETHTFIRGITRSERTLEILRLQGGKVRFTATFPGGSTSFAREVVEALKEDRCHSATVEFSDPRLYEAHRLGAQEGLSKGKRREEFYVPELARFLGEFLRGESEKPNYQPR